MEWSLIRAGWPSADLIFPVSLLRFFIFLHLGFLLSSFVFTVFLFAVMPLACLLLLNQPYCFSSLCSLIPWILFSFLLSLFHGVPFLLCFVVIVNSFFLERLIASTNTHRVLDSLMLSPLEIFSQFWTLLETVIGPISRNHMLTCLIGSALLLFGCNKGFLLVCNSPTPC